MDDNARMAGLSTAGKHRKQVLCEHLLAQGIDDVLSFLASIELSLSHGISEVLYPESGD